MFHFGSSIQAVIDHVLTFSTARCLDSLVVTFPSVRVSTALARFCDSGFWARRVEIQQSTGIEV